MKSVRLTVAGRVQGVFFRVRTRDEARRLGVQGSVRNLPNGKVEILAAGNDDQVDRLIRWARQGPPGAQVMDVQVEPLSPGSFLEGFSILH